MEKNLYFLIDDKGKKTHAVMPIETYYDLIKLKDLIVNTTKISNKEGAEIYYLKKKALLARGYVEGDRAHPNFILLKDSQLTGQDSPSIPDNVKALKLKLINEGALNLDPQGRFYNLSEDLTLPSPTFAAAMVTGNACNGTLLWKNREGFSLKQAGFGYHKKGGLKSQRGKI